MFQKNLQQSCSLVEKDINELGLLINYNIENETIGEADLLELSSQIGAKQKSYIKKLIIETANGKRLVLVQNKNGVFCQENDNNLSGGPTLTSEIYHGTDEVVYKITNRELKGKFSSVYGVFYKQPFFKSLIGYCDLSTNHLLWAIDKVGQVIYTSGGTANIPSTISFSNIGLIPEKGGAIKHTINDGSSKVKVLSVFHPIEISQNIKYLVLSYPERSLAWVIVQDSFIYGIAAIIIIIILIVFFTKLLRNQSLEQERIRQSEMALTKVLHYLPTGIILIDKNRRIRQINKAAVKLFQLEDEDLVIGQEYGENLIFSKFRIKEKYQVSLQGKRYLVIDEHKNERLFYNDKIPFFLQTELYYLESFHELTSFINPEKSGLQGFKPGFITNISHELRTPLTGLLGMIDMLTGSPNLSEHEKEISVLAKRSGEILMSLINDILDFSRMESGKLEIESIPFNLKEEIDSLIKEFLPQAREKKIIITTSFNDPLPGDFIGDPVRLRQVISNLLNNAIKFTPFGTVQIATCQAKTLNGGPAIMFCIKDSGIGIKNEKLQEIFEPFSQADPSLNRHYGGTGLGTTISKQLVLLMGGEIFAKSPSGLSSDPEYPGAEICFTLPLKTRRVSKNLDFSGIFSFAQIKCLIVTDDSIEVHTLTRNLIALKVDFTVLPPSRETIETLRKKNSFNMVVIDHRYDLNGIDFLQEMHNHQVHNNYLVILQSSDYISSNTSIAHRLGADVYLRKPIPIGTLKDFLFNNFPKLLVHERNAALPLPEQIRILVIEDNKLNQKVARNLFRKIGYETNIVNSIESASGIIEKGGIDVIFLEFSILQAARHTIASDIKITNAGCRLVVMASTTEINDDTRNFLLQNGIDGFLIKPFNTEQITDMLFKMVAQ